MSESKEASFVFGVATVAVFAAAACSSNSAGNSPGGGAGAATNASTICSSIVDHAKQCNSSVDVSTEMAQCNNQNDPFLSKLRSDVGSALNSCVSASDCTHTSSSITDCVGTEQQMITPSSTAVKFCMDYVNKVATCTSAMVNEGDCLGTYKIFSDGALSSADQSCVSQECTQVDDCLTANFGLSSVGGSSPSTTPSSGSTSASSGSATGGGGSSGSSSGSTSCPSGTDACGACNARSCCGEQSACTSNTDCVALANCINGCGSGATSCVTGCEQSHPTGTSIFKVFVNCTEANCKTPCGG